MRYILAVVILASLCAVGAAFDRFMVERDHARLMAFLHGARRHCLTHSLSHVMEFHGREAVLKRLETGEIVDSLTVWTLRAVSYNTTLGEKRIAYNARGLTAPYNLRAHGGDIRLRSLLGSEKAIWVHCTDYYWQQPCEV